MSTVYEMVGTLSAVTVVWIALLISLTNIHIEGLINTGSIG
jgi:hypothetical protein